MAREALVGDAAGARTIVAREGRDADPGGLAVVVAQRRPVRGGDELVLRRRGEDAALGNDGEVEALCCGDPGVDLDPARRLDLLQRRDVAAEAIEEALGRARLRLEPRRLQRRDDGAVAHYRAEHRHRLVDGADRQRRLAEAPRQRAEQRRRVLRDVNLGDRLRAFGPPRAEPLQQLDAADRERERARIGADVLG